MANMNTINPSQRIRENLMSKISGLITLLVITILSLSSCSKPDTLPSNLKEESFVNPPTENRPMALWPWLNGFVDTTKMVYELEQMKEKGMRGVLIWDLGALINPENTIPEGPAFLGEESLEYIQLALNTSHKLGLDLGMVAASSWNSGGPWVDSTEASMQLLHTSQIVTGPSNKKSKLIYPPAHKRSGANRHVLLTTLAIPYSPTKKTDDKGAQFVLDQYVSSDGTIDWDVPEGKWEILSFFMSNTGQNLVVPSPNSSGLIIDHLSKRATKVHIDSLLARLAPISTDESHLKFLMLDSYEVWPMQDWSPELIQEFKEKYEYDPIPLLPILKGYTSGDTIYDERFRGDYKRLVSDMMIENHYTLAMEMANKNDIQMISEAGHGGYARVDPLKGLGHSDIPMGEFWNRKRHWVTKEAASAAHIYGRKLVASESLTGWNHWQHGPTDFKQLIDRAFTEGLNQLVFHTFAHNPEVAGKPGFVYHAGEHVNVNATWWEMARPFMDYIGRSSYMLRQGNFVGDACLYYGDQAPNLVPTLKIDPNITPIFSEGKCLHCGRTIPINAGETLGYDYDYMNAEIITNAMQVEDGRIMLPHGQSYRVMMIPDRVDISLEVLRSIKKLVNDGAVILGRRPERATSLKNYPECDEEVKSIAAELWGDIDGETVFSNDYGKGTVYWGKSLKQVLKELQVVPDFEVTGTGNSKELIDYIHRKTDTEDIYFIANSSQQEQKVTCTFRVDGKKVPELWDAVTGKIQKDVAYSNVKNGISIALELEPIASRFVVFRDQSSEKNEVALANNLQYGFLKNSDTKSIDITKGWNISFDTKMGGPESYQMESLTDWSSIDVDGIKYYSGSATYTREFNIEKELLNIDASIYVAFDDIQEMARVFVNGQDCGIIWTPPYRTDITKQVKAGINTMTVQVINTWNNRIVGDIVNQGKDYTMTNAKNRFSKESPLLKSGLTGKATVMVTTK